jgi:SAM-dependent methyltransferase
LFFDGCPNYSFFPAGRRVHFNFFWNPPTDTLTYDVGWRIQRLRNQIEGNPASDNYLAMSNSNMPQPGETAGMASATSFRVVGTVDGGGLETHKDWAHDPSKVQMSLVLSAAGVDYEEGGFLFRKRNGVIVNLSREASLQPGDLLIFRYCMDHGVEPVRTSVGQIGFWRILFPIEAMRSKKLGTYGKPNNKSSILRRWAGWGLRQIRGGASMKKVADTNPQMLLLDPVLAPMAEIAIQSGVSPSEVFYKKGLFARWHAMQKWQFEALRIIGLQPDHRFLDIGCGVLRLGMVLIPYLESDRYFGTDPVPAYLETSRRYAASVLKTDKQFSLLLDRSFEFHKFGKKFDYAMAHSVFTHMTSQEISACFRCLAGVMAPGGKLLFTVALDPNIREDYQETFVYNAQIPMVRSHHASDAFYRSLAEEIGFQLELLSSPRHPSQSTFVATFGSTET